MTEKDNATKYRGSIPVWNRLSYKHRGMARRSVYYAILIATVVVITFPLFWMWSTALRPEDLMYQRPVPIFPSDITLAHFESLIFETNFLTFYINSIIYSVGVVILTTVSATLGGYGLARLTTKHRKTFARVVLFGYMFPAILLAIPMFLFWKQLGILNTYAGLMLGITATTLPFCLWLMWKFFQTVPYSLEESARMAGATRFEAFYQIAVPLAKPGVVAVAVFSFALTWSQFTIPQVLMTDESKWPLTVGLYTFQQANTIMWGELMAACALMVLPRFLFIFSLQKYLLRGFQTGDIG
jgi:multiple sugar transport system permease protein